MDAQTEELLEVLTDKPAVASTETQTEAFIDRPSSPLFVPAKSGADVVTQVVVGDLFDFDLEVRATNRRVHRKVTCTMTCLYLIPLPER